MMIKLEAASKQPTDALPEMPLKVWIFLWFSSTVLTCGLVESQVTLEWLHLLLTFILMLICQSLKTLIHISLTLVLLTSNKCLILAKIKVIRFPLSNAFPQVFPKMNLVKAHIDFDLAMNLAPLRFYPCDP